MRRRITILLLGAMTLVTGISAEEMPAQVSVPERWIYTSSVESTLPADDAWWSTFNDETLTRLIALGEKNNFNLSAAIHRIAAARHAWKADGAGYFPTIGLQGGWTAMQESLRTTASFHETDEVDYFNVGAQMSWEIDLFGRIRAQRKASKAQLNATRADFAGTQVAVAASIAKAYIALRMYQQQLLTAQEQVKSQQKILDMAQTRKDVGLASGLDVSQARQVQLTTEASIPRLEAMIRTSVNAIALLVGEYPQALSSLLAPVADLPQTPAAVQAGTPADMLRRRPDIAAAEAQLAVYAAQVGVAKKDFLPTLTLNGAIGTDAHRAGDLFRSHSFTWQVTPTLSWTLFDGLARNYRVAEAREQMQAQLDSYNLTVMTAVQEVEDALADYDSACSTITYDEQLLKQTEKTLELSVDLYKQGLSDFSNVANAQISLLNARNSVIASRANALTTLVTLYQALGGGWQPFDENATN